MNVIGMAGRFWNNRVLKIREESRGRSKIFDKLIAPCAVRVERALLPPPFGLSLNAIGCKRREPV